ncbi:DMT family transporter [Patescibacteria group bacterium]|nr:DMT family transporter [Patescibacteria group bacterium]
MNISRKKAYLALLTTSVIWGLAPPIIKYTLGFISPFTFLFYRFMLASVILAVPFTIKLIKIKPSFNDFLKYTLLGFLGTPLTLFILFTGIQKTTAVDASIIAVITPILVILGGVLFLKEKVTATEKKGIALILLGTIITILQPLFETGLSVVQNIYGNTLVFVGSLTWAIFTLLSKKEKKLDSFILSSFSFVVGMFCFSLLALTGNSFSAEFEINKLNLNAFLGIVYMAVLGSVVAYYTYIYGLSKIEASEATIFTYLQPVFAVPISIIFLKEKVDFAFMVGAVIIIVGVFVCEFFGKRLFSLKTKPKLSPSH